MVDDKIRPYSSKYAKVSGKPDTDAIPYERIPQLKKMVNKESVVLDIGMGTGYKTIPIAKFCKHFYGLDPNFELLQIARKNK
ncbi:MAG: class I SAM-dependent methyltransferase, partial [Candidatus Aenigmarchaeota archaeon]|nr:class I SAM-dependent methyltransferase [Candidatus Aenigmarchaeota archaeon]